MPRNAMVCLPYRYRIRGVRHVVFYGPPQHGHYYSEMLNQLEEAASSAKEPVSCIVSALALAVTIPQH